MSLNEIQGRGQEVEGDGQNEKRAKITPSQGEKG
jgi:hypothetical protein